jgi:hypothetical protein
MIQGTLANKASYSIGDFQGLLDGREVAHTLQRDEFGIRESSRKNLAVLERHDWVGRAMYDQATRRDGP